MHVLVHQWRPGHLRVSPPMSLDRTDADALFSGDLWTANQWNEAETPGGTCVICSCWSGILMLALRRLIGPSGAWTYDSVC